MTDSQALSLLRRAQRALWSMRYLVRGTSGEDEEPYRIAGLAHDEIRAYLETVEKEPAPNMSRVLGCAHGRDVGVPCPHCLGINR